MAMDVLTNATVPYIGMDNTTHARTAGEMSNDSVKDYEQVNVWEDAAEDKLSWTSNVLNVVLIPAFILIGIIGNSLSLIVFLRSQLRFQSSTLYLAFLNAVDIGFLLCLLVTWFSWMDVHMFHHQGICQLVVYLTYVFSFLSVWTVAAFTAERYIVVVWPLKRLRFCTCQRAGIVVAVLTGVALLLYCYATWTIGIVYNHGTGGCVIYHDHLRFVNVMTHIDTIVTYVIPSVVIVTLNMYIAYKLCLYGRDRVRQARPPEELAVDQEMMEGQEGAINTPASNGSSRDVILQRPEQPRPLLRTSSAHGSLSANFQYQTTRTLLLLSTVFVLLNMPSHVVRMYVLAVTFSNHADYIMPKEIQSYQQICYLPHYMNFAANFFLYVGLSRSFRQALRGVARGWKNKLHERFGVRSSTPGLRY